MLRDAPPACGARGLLDQGSLPGDGVLLAVVTRGCDGDGPATCTIADGTAPIAREIVPKGIAQDCVAFNQYIGIGLPTVPGYLTGECFTRAEVASPPGLLPRKRYPRVRC